MDFAIKMENMDRSRLINFEFLVKYEDGSKKIADINAESFAHACLRFYKRDINQIEIIGFELIEEGKLRSTR